MTNRSNILPGTFHVHIDLDAYSARLTDWCRKQATARVDIFAYETDDLLDHAHIGAVIDGIAQFGFFAANGLHRWEEMLEQNGSTGTYLFAFSDANSAVLFKLANGGAA